MKPTLHETFLAYLTLFSGLILSIVAEYYSIVGLTSIFSASIIPVVIMGIALGIGKVTATIWLKQNWDIAPLYAKAYLTSAICILMFITAIGIFGFLSKAHSDQTLVSGDVAAKIAIYDDKIKTEQENIDANRKAIKQMDEAVDQVMGRSTSETGADKAVAIRKSQQKERIRLQTEISTSQKAIVSIKEARAPIAAEIRKVEAEVGPIKYIAAFFYGSTDPTILDRAVTWVIIILIVVFDPLAVILLLASQISFQKFKDYPKYEKDDAPLTTEQLNQISASANIDSTQDLKVVSSILEEPLFVQNEEQTSSNLWTKTVTTGTDNTVIVDNSPRNKTAIIDHWVNLVKSRKVTMSDVPKNLLLEVRARV